MKELIYMKKIITFLIVLFIIPLNVYAKKEKVTLSKCIDGDTISVLIKKEEKKVRFLAVDSPEIDKEEPYSLEAKSFTCDILQNAKNIYLEYDNKSDKVDKYERVLAWVWADDILVQKELVHNGYAKVAYVYDEYKYVSELKEFENFAKENKMNIWSSYKPKKIKEEKKISKKDKLIANLNRSYSYIVALIAAILAVLTFYKRKKR